jgi:hypothetical protein
VDDLEKFSESELHDKLIEVHTIVEAANKGAEVGSSSSGTGGGSSSSGSSSSSSSAKLPAALAGHGDLFSKPRRELATMLHGVLVTQKAQADAAAAAADAAADEAEDRSMSMLRLLTTGRADRPSASTLSSGGLRRVQSERYGYEPRLRGPSFTPAAAGRTGSLSSPHYVRIDTHGGGLSSSLTGGAASQLVHGGGRGGSDNSDDVSDDDSDFFREADRRQRREEERQADLRALRRDVHDVDRLAMRAADQEMRQEGAHRHSSGSGAPNTQQRYIVISSGRTSSGAGGNSVVTGAGGAGIVSSSASYTTLPLRTPQMPRNQPAGPPPLRSTTLNELD